MLTNNWGPLKSSAVSFTRAVGLAVVGAVPVALLAAVALNVRQPDPVASLEIGISHEVVWPFFEVAVGQAQSVAEEQEALLRDELGPDFIEYSVEREEGSLLFDIRVTATSADAAMSGAEAAFAATVSTMLDERSETVQTQLLILRETHVVATAAAETTEADYVLALAQRELAETALEDAEARAAAEGLSTSRTALDREVAELESDIADAELVLALLAPDVQVISVTPADASSRSSKRLAAAAGLSAALLIGAAVLAFDRSHGPIRSAKHGEAELGVRCLCASADGSVSTELERVVRHAATVGHKSLLITGPAKAAFAEVTLPDELVDGQNMRLVTDQAQDADLLGTCSGVVLLTPMHGTTVRSLKKQLANHESSGLEAVGVVLTC